MDKRLQYLRVSLLNHCNLSCFYCRPPGTLEGKKSRAAIETLHDAIATLHHFGARKVRFTGGEPTLYRGLPDLVARTKALTPQPLCAMTTNAILLDRLAAPLGEAGLDSVNISLDTLSPEKFERISGKDALPKVLEGIDAAISAIPSVKLNCVVIRGVNDDETEAMVRFADTRSIDIRFIEYMPTKHNSNEHRSYLPGDEVRAKLPFAFEPDPTAPSSAARYFRSGELQIRVGFINPVSHSFCEHCNRIRLAADGRLYGCLFSGASVNLFELLGSGREATRNALQSLLDNKQFRGCSVAGHGDGDLPSFVNIGG